jgi:hypothetical protein
LTNAKSKTTPLKIAQQKAPHALQSIRSGNGGMPELPRTEASA